MDLEATVVYIVKPCLKKNKNLKTKPVTLYLSNNSVAEKILKQQKLYKKAKS